MKNEVLKKSSSRKIVLVSESGEKIQNDTNVNMIKILWCKPKMN